MSRDTKYKYDNYDERLLNYITEYTRKVGVPPTVDLMVENVEGRTSKSTVHLHCKKMVDEGLLVQKNIKGYYYPTSIEYKEVSVPRYLLNAICNRLESLTPTDEVTKRLKEYL